MLRQLTGRIFMPYFSVVKCSFNIIFYFRRETKIIQYFLLQWFMHTIDFLLKNGKLSTPGIEPGLSRPQRDVLTARRCRHLVYACTKMYIACIELNLNRSFKECVIRAVPGIEPGTSPTLRENHTTRPNSRLSACAGESLCHAPALTIAGAQKNMCSDAPNGKWQLANVA